MADATLHRSVAAAASPRPAGAFAVRLASGALARPRFRLAARRSLAEHDALDDRKLANMAIAREETPHLARVSAAGEPGPRR